MTRSDISSDLNSLFAGAEGGDCRLHCGRTGDGRRFS